MGTIKIRKNRGSKITYHAEVRRRGFPALYKSFPRMTDARAWVQDTESDFRKGRSLPTAEAMRRTLANAIERYIAEAPAQETRPFADKKRHTDASFSPKQRIKLQGGYPFEEVRLR